MGVEEILGGKRDEIRRIATRHGAYNIRVFGSAARGEAGPKSNLDLLVDCGPDVTPFFPGGLLADLEELLGRRVEVITEPGLNPYIRERVLKEAVPL